MSTRHAVVLLPGGVLPAEPAYAALLEVLGERVDAVVKDLEVYADDEPPPDYSLDTEVEGILREADAHGFDRFHLVGYSGGGASSLAFAAEHGERLLSLALLEPAWAGNERHRRRRRSGSASVRSSRCRPTSSWRGSCDCNSRPVSSRRRRPTARPRRGWPSAPRVCAPSSTRSTTAISTSKRCGRSTGRSTSRSAAAATPTTTAEWPSGWPRSSPTSRSRRSRSATTSTRRTGSSPSALQLAARTLGARRSVTRSSATVPSPAYLDHRIDWLGDPSSTSCLRARVRAKGARLETAPAMTRPDHRLRIWQVGARLRDSSAPGRRDATRATPSPNSSPDPLETAIAGSAMLQDAEKGGRRHALRWH